MEFRKNRFLILDRSVSVAKNWVGFESRGSSFQRPRLGLGMVAPRQGTRRFDSSSKERKTYGCTVSTLSRLSQMTLASEDFRISWSWGRFDKSVSP
jgi:hypothetical protein